LLVSARAEARGSFSDWDAFARCHFRMLIDLSQPERSWQDVYRLCVTFVTPRPIALVSTVSADGVRNLAPFSFFNMVSANPPVMMVCPARTRDGGQEGHAGQHRNHR
jgi:hypothetical protein